MRIFLIPFIALLLVNSAFAASFVEEGHESALEPIGKWPNQPQEPSGDLQDHPFKPIIDPIEPFHFEPLYYPDWEFLPKDRHRKWPHPKPRPWKDMVPLASVTHSCA